MACNGTALLSFYFGLSHYKYAKFELSASAAGGLAFLGTIDTFTHKQTQTHTHIYKYIY
jgi:hypothetical protein